MRRAAGVAGVVLLAVVVGAGTFVFDFRGDPGDCGLGTGGVLQVAETPPPVTGPDPAWQTVREAYRANDSRLASFAANRSAYRHVHRSALQAAFTDALFARADPDRLARDETLYFFVATPSPVSVAEYDRTIVVTRDGTLHVVIVGAC